jgi:beta-mannanase
MAERSRSSPLAFGIYDPWCPPLLMRPAALEDYLQVSIKVVSWYQAWGSAHAPCFPEICTEAHHRGMIPLISWEPWKLPGELPAGTAPHAQPDYSLEKIGGGAYDGYIRSWARCLRQVAKPIFLRPMHEMNGNWYPWGGTVNGNDPPAFIRAWKHLHRLFREEMADNVLWVWCPFAHSLPDTPGNVLEHYFPGEKLVDWLALDLYNHSTQGASWQSFSQMFASPYKRLLALAPDKPVMIAEIGCAEAGGDKAAWIKEALLDLADKYPRVEVVVWFHINKECDWRIDSSPSALAAFREAARGFLS